MTAVQVASIAVVALYLLAFFAGSALAARAAGRKIWLFGAARGADRAAAFGFRAGFALAVLGPLLAWLFPALADLDPLWHDGMIWTALPGQILAVAGAMLAFAAQMAMGASWRVGVQSDAVGALVSDGLYTLSRNPTFLGQAMLFLGVVLAVPSVAGALSVALFVISAQIQIRSEEAALRASHGPAFDAFRAATPRWIGVPRRQGRSAG